MYATHFTNSAPTCADRVGGPILLGYSPENQQEAVTEWASLGRHRDEDQVQLDVNRSFVYYPESMQRPSTVCAILPSCQNANWWKMNPRREQKLESRSFPMS